MPNPFNLKQTSRVSLLPEDVDLIVFWTRNPKPIFPYLDELDQLGYTYYFQYTLLGYPDQIENYTYIAAALTNYTFHSVISLMDTYSKTRKRIEQLNQVGLGVIDFDRIPKENFDDLMRSFVSIAQENGLYIQSCAEDLDLALFGIRPGKCIDDAYIQAVFGREVSTCKDPGQRKSCGCVVSKDIGMYDSCLFGCPYCYATGNSERVQANHSQHNPLSPSLMGWYD